MSRLLIYSVAFFANSTSLTAGSILMPSQVDSKPAISLSNGDESPLMKDVDVEDIAARSESDLSEARDNAARSPSPDAMSQDAPYDEDDDGMGETQSSQDEDADGSEDEDYNINVSTPAIRIDERPQSSGSEGSIISSKRKATVEDDDYILKNPELYGLRRSVSRL